jgi:hypothetical protein
MASIIILLFLYVDSIIRENTFVYFHLTPILLGIIRIVDGYVAQALGEFERFIKKTILSTLYKIIKILLELEKCQLANHLHDTLMKVGLPHNLAMSIT